MLERPLTGPRAWRADTIDGPQRWCRQLPDRILAVLDTTLRDWRGRPATDVHLADTPCAACADELRPARDDLETGRGFVVLRGLPDRCGPDELRLAYWLVGQMLGQPVAQNVQGTLLYDVKDTGQDVRYGARFSVTNAESSFHTDNSFGDDIVDCVGLLCLNPSRSGGLSQMVSGHAIHNHLLAEYPEVLPALYRPFHVDRRGGLRPGDAPTVPFPVFSWDGRELLLRYLRYWIEAGHEKVGQPLTAEQHEALDTLDRIAAAPELRAEFALQPGDMYFLNNRWILHNRTAFEDFEEPQRRRHLVRLWLRA